MIIIDNYFEKKNYMNIQMKTNKIEESCIHHLYLHLIFISLVVLIFQNRKLPIISTKILSFLRQENRTEVA